MDRRLSSAAVTAFAAVAVAAFAASMLVPAVFPDQAALAGLPLVAVAAIWVVPLAVALARGERWAFVIGLAVLIFVTDSSFRARDWTDKSLDWQVLLKASVWAGAGLIGVLRLARTARLVGTPPVAFGLAFVAVLALSAAWSPLPLYTLQSAAAYGWLFLFGLAAAEVLDEDGLLKAVALGCGLVVLPSLAIAPFAMGIAPTSPGATGEADRLRGITDHPIPLAEEAALFTFACLALWTRTRGIGPRLALALLAAAGAATVALTQSRIPPMAMAAAALGYWAYRKGGWMLMVPSLLLCVVVVLTMESMAGFSSLLPRPLLELLSRSGESSEILTLSGRLVIWPYVLDRIAEAPLVGHGHASGMVLFKAFTRWKITHAHDAYLQALLYVGLLGAVPLVAALVAQLRVFLVRPRPVRDMVFLYMLLKGVTEQSFLSNMPSGAVVLWMVTLGLAGLAWRSPKPARSGAGTVPASPASTAPSRGSAAPTHARRSAGPAARGDTSPGSASPAPAAGRGPSP